MNEVSQTWGTNDPEQFPSQVPIDEHERTKATIVRECGILRSKLKSIEEEIRTLHSMGYIIGMRDGNGSDAYRNLDLALNAAEEIRMRLGKVIRYCGDGVSVYDKKPDTGHPEPSGDVVTVAVDPAGASGSVTVVRDAWGNTRICDPAIEAAKIQPPSHPPRFVDVHHRIPSYVEQSEADKTPAGVVENLEIAQQELEEEKKKGIAI